VGTGRRQQQKKTPFVVMLSRFFNTVEAWLGLAAMLADGRAIYGAFV
jgi:hypothetical protein